MDLYNNAVGRKLAADPKNKDKDPETVIMDAFNKGLLQTSVNDKKGNQPKVAPYLSKQK